MLRLLGDVQQLGHLPLHLEGELVRLDHAVELFGSADWAARSWFMAWIRSICLRWSDFSTWALRLGKTPGR